LWLILMDELASCCGLLCSECPAYLATQKNDDAERQNVAELWTKEYGRVFKKEDINCGGCMSNGPHFGYCDKCEIRACGVQKKVENCAFCPDYACERLSAFFANAPKAKENLDRVGRNNTHRTKKS